MPSINIKRIELVVVTNKPLVIEENDFSTWETAFKYLEKQLNQPLSAEYREAFTSHPYTETNPCMEMVTDGTSAYSASVYYAVTVGGAK